MKQIITTFLAAFCIFQQANAARYFDIQQTSGQNFVGQTVEFLAVYFVTPPYPATATPVDWSSPEISVTISGGTMMTKVSDCGYNPCPGGIITFEITTPTVTITIEKTTVPTANSSFTFTALPVELVKFDAKPLEKQVNLTWTTASETNNREFGIEQSWDGENWKIIGKQNGAGTTRETMNYLFIDFVTNSNPQAKTTYYRLRTTDFDGAESHSEMISVELNSQVNRLEFGTVSSELLRFKSPNEENIEVSFFNFSGQLLFKKSILAQKGFNEMPVDVQMSHGIYVVRMSSATQSAALKIKI